MGKNGDLLDDLKMGHISRERESKKKEKKRRLKKLKK